MGADQWKIDIIREGMLSRKSSPWIAERLRCSRAMVCWIIRHTPELFELRPEYQAARLVLRQRKFTDEGLIVLIKAGKTPNQCAIIFGVDKGNIYRRIRANPEINRIYKRQRNPRSRFERDALVPGIACMMRVGAKRSDIRAAFDLTLGQLVWILDENPDVFGPLRRKALKTTKKQKHVLTVSIGHEITTYRNGATRKRQPT